MAISTRAASFGTPQYFLPHALALRSGQTKQQSEKPAKAANAVTKVKAQEKKAIAKAQAQREENRKHRKRWIAGALVAENLLVGGLAFVAIRNAIRIENNASTDSLTGHKLGRYLFRYGNDIQKKLERENPENETWLVWFDVNGLKLANTLFDHSGGDTLLKEMAYVIGSSLPKDQHFMGRMHEGGDEFYAMVSAKNKDALHEMIRTVQLNALAKNFNLGIVRNRIQEMDLEAEVQLDSVVDLILYDTYQKEKAVMEKANTQAYEFKNELETFDAYKRAVMTKDHPLAINLDTRYFSGFGLTACALKLDGAQKSKFTGRYNFQEIVMTLANMENRARHDQNTNRRNFLQSHSQGLTRENYTEFKNGLVIDERQEDRGKSIDERYKKFKPNLMTRIFGLQS